MLTNADVTIYNQWVNREAGQMEYRKTVIREVHWHSTIKTAVADNALQSADVYKVRIPKESPVDGEKQYLPADQYQVLPPEEVDHYWTIGREDYLIKGESAAESIVEILGSDVEMCKIIGFSDNSTGLNPHFRVEGKR